MHYSVWNVYTTDDKVGCVMFREPAETDDKVGSACACRKINTGSCN